MFKIYDYRTRNTHNLTSDELKDVIITTTNSVYENTRVLSERTGKRPTLIEPFLNTLTNGVLLKGVFLVTALSRVNRDPNTRYMLVATGDKDQYLDFLSKINPQIPFIHVDCSAFTPIHEGGYLSTWFRNTMGRAFSFIDIDFIFLKANKIILIEEKTHIGELGYGQEMSYNELLRDIFNVPSTLCVAKYDTSTQNIETLIKQNSSSDFLKKIGPIQSFIDALNK
ncbi:MAG: hypothetical protein ACRC18_07275 [Cetobacterium sp.]